MNEIHQAHRRVDLNHLRVFEVIYRERSLTRAAEALSLTPSALSHALRRMREVFDDPLFVRDGHEMVPTPWCNHIAGDILEEMTRLRAMLRRWERFDPAEHGGTVTISMPDSLEHLFLPKLYRFLSQAAPDVRLILTGHSRRNLVSDLRRRAIDLVVDVTAQRHDNLESETVFHSDWSLACRSGHPGIGHMDAAQFAATDHIAVSSRSFGAVLEDPALATLGIKRAVRIRCQNYSSAFETIADTDLLLTIPNELARRLPKKDFDVVVSDHPLTLPPVSLHLLWHSENTEDARSLWLRSLVKACFA